jgi:heme-degrading monooxygenase HmoA
MIIEYIRYTVPLKQQADFVRDYAKAKEPLLRSLFALNLEISQCIEDESQYIVRIEWTSADDHMQKFRASAEFSEFLPHIKPYIGMIDEMRHYEQR